ncbi:hypothetical protein CSUB01_09195 [Colletotrichum sublineola]|uniref:Uncharacterized protein n=1 Tax=Colletotrichum sublineola TaxID=1173701 RepID=A0A066WTG7_COLSU|nr:hypothetical protein CSUB01_09195 [Colletotrichum sublineola]
MFHGNSAARRSLPSTHNGSPLAPRNTASTPSASTPLIDPLQAAAADADDGLKSIPPAGTRRGTPLLRHPVDVEPRIPFDREPDPLPPLC